MLKLSALIATLSFIVSSWLSGSILPRFTGGPLDYVLMPLLGYVSIIIAAHLAVRLRPGQVIED